MLNVTGLLEMMFDVLSAWIEDFLLDIDQLDSDSPTDTPGSGPGSAQVSPRSLAAHSPVQSEYRLPAFASDTSPNLAERMKPCAIVSNSILHVLHL